MYSTVYLTTPLRSIANRYSFRHTKRDQMIFRKVYLVVPPKVEYDLIDIGKKISRLG